MEEQQQQLQLTLMQRLRKYLLECRRVFFITKKPTKEEFKTIVKVSGLGILVIGFIGFLIQMIRLTLF